MFLSISRMMNELAVHICCGCAESELDVGLKSIDNERLVLCSRAQVQYIK